MAVKPLEQSGALADRVLTDPERSRLVSLCRDRFFWAPI